MDELVVKIENLNKFYGKKRALTNVSLEIPKGCIYGLLGPSGCGKTTAVKIIAGILKANEGKVSIFGKEMPNLDLMSDIGYMGQKSALYEQLSAYENLKFFGKIYGLKKMYLKKESKILLIY